MRENNLKNNPLKVRGTERESDGERENVLFFRIKKKQK